MHNNNPFPFTACKQNPLKQLVSAGAGRERRRLHQRGDQTELAGPRGRHPGGGGPVALLLPQELLREQGLDADGARREVGREQVQPGGEGEDDEDDARVLNERTGKDQRDISARWSESREEEFTG